MEPLKQPRSAYDLALRQANQARSDFAAIGDDLELIMGQLPKRKDLGWTALAAFLCGARLCNMRQSDFLAVTGPAPCP